MKIRLPIPKKNYQDFLIRDLISNHIAIYSDIFIDSNKIDLETYPSWDFYKVSVFKQTKKHGYGSLEYRNGIWEETKTSIVNLFDIKGETRYTWQWLRGDPKDYDKVDDYELYAPGIEVCIYKIRKSNANIS